MQQGTRKCALLKAGDSPSVLRWRFPLSVCSGQSPRRARRARHCVVAMVVGLRCKLTGYCLAESRQGPHEERLIEDIFGRRKYQMLARPVAEESELVIVYLGVSLQQIVDVVSSSDNRIICHRDRGAESLS